MSLYIRYPATGGGGGGAVDSVNGQTGVVVLDADDISDAATTNKYATQAQLDKVDFLTVTQPVDLDQLETDITGALQASNNLSDVADAATSRTNLGLGTAALSNTGDFATAAQGALADTALQPANNLSDVSSATTSRTNLGLGTAATADSTDFAPAPVVNVQTGTSYTLQASDDGAIVTLNNAATITLTLPDSLPAGFNCLIIQLGAGQVQTALGGGASLDNRQGHTDLFGQYAVGSLVVAANPGSAAEYILAGDTA
jgi:hypothetical protein